jgi:hypothetical protein
VTVREAAAELQCSNRPQHARQPGEQGQPRHDEHAVQFVRRLVGKGSGRADLDRSHPVFGSSQVLPICCLSWRDFGEKETRLFASVRRCEKSCLFQVVLGSDHLGIADPLTNDMERVFGRQFCFPRRAEVVEGLAPRFHAGALAEPSNRSRVEGDRRLDARYRNEHDSFAAFAEPKKRAAIVWVFINVVHFATKRTEPGKRSRAERHACSTANEVRQNQSRTGVLRYVPQNAFACSLGTFKQARIFSRNAPVVYVRTRALRISASTIV